MPGKQLQGSRVAILVTNGFEQVEMQKPREALDEAGAETVLISPNEGKVLGLNHIGKGNEFSVEMLLQNADPDDFDAVLLPGGVVNADSIRMNKAAQKFVQAIDKSGKPIAVICHGTWLLVSAGLVKGRKMTSFFTIQDDIRNAGGDWTDQETVLDRNWVSSRKPDDIPAFNKAMLELFASKQKSARSARA